MHLRAASQEGFAAIFVGRDVEPRGRLAGRARKNLQQIARGDPDAWDRQEAKAALARLAKQPSKE
jgi:hypothetical protein